MSRSAAFIDSIVGDDVTPTIPLELALELDDVTSTTPHGFGRRR